MKNILIELRSNELNNQNKITIENVEEDNAIRLHLCFNISHPKSHNAKEGFDLTSKLLIEYDNSDVNIHAESENTKELDLSKLLNNPFDFTEFSKLLKEKIIVFPEFRNKPTNNASPAKVSTTGLELNNHLFNLKNSNDPSEPQKFKEIERVFNSIFNIDIFLAYGKPLSFIKNNLKISVDGIGGGVIESLIILTHLISEKNKIFFLDEPELHLHPHNKRILKKILENSSSNNQIIYITHSAEFINSSELDKISLVRLINGTSKIFKCPIDIKNDEFMQRSLLRLTRSEQKEFFFARKVLLVEGETEMSAFPIFADRLDYNFDIESVSVISINNNYFVSFIRILKAFNIPFLIVCDSDVAMDINDKVKNGTDDIKISSLFEQLKQVSSLKNTELDALQELQKDISGIDKPRFDDKIKDTVYGLLKEQGKYRDINFKILSDDFEGMFQTNIFEKNKKKANGSKILHGYYLANELSLGEIPEEVKEIITELKNI